jgi:rhamnosyltransferase
LLSSVVEKEKFGFKLSTIMDQIVKKKFCGVVTFYNPPENYMLNISTFSRFLDKIFIVDNTPGDNDSNHQSLLQRFPNVVVLSTGKNLGIAKAINLGIEAALENSASWLLTMDQDSYFDVDQAEKYFKSCAEIDKDKVAILSPSHEKVPTEGAFCYYKKQDAVMTSGNLLNLSVIRNIGFFNEDLFIDSVDHDYCLRANLLGFEVLQATNCFIQHVVGDLYQGSLMFGLKKKTFHIHSPKRMYFIVRNGLYIRKKYGKEFPVYTKMLKRVNYQRVSKCLRYSDCRIEYVRSLIKAYYDYSRKRFGNRVGI